MKVWKRGDKLTAADLNRFENFSNNTSGSVNESTNTSPNSRILQCVGELVDETKLGLKDQSGEEILTAETLWQAALNGTSLLLINLVIGDETNTILTPINGFVSTEDNTSFYHYYMIGNGQVLGSDKLSGNNQILFLME